jgi:hypothetical protein
MGAKQQAIHGQLRLPSQRVLRLLPSAHNCSWLATGQQQLLVIWEAAGFGAACYVGLAPRHAAAAQLGLPPSPRSSPFWLLPWLPSLPPSRHPSPVAPLIAPFSSLLVLLYNGSTRLVQADGQAASRCFLLRGQPAVARCYPVWQGSCKGNAFRLHGIVLPWRASGCLQPRSYGGRQHNRAVCVCDTMSSHAHVSIVTIVSSVLQAASQSSQSDHCLTVLPCKTSSQAHQAPPLLHHVSHSIDEQLPACTSGMLLLHSSWQLIQGEGSCAGVHHQVS